VHVQINMLLRTISRIDDYKMVSGGPLAAVRATVVCPSINHRFLRWPSHTLATCVCSVSVRFDIDVSPSIERCLLFGHQRLSRRPPFPPTRQRLFSATSNTIQRPSDLIRRSRSAYFTLLVWCQCPPGGRLSILICARVDCRRSRPR
jgi:hypothetical protein